MENKVYLKDYKEVAEEYLKNEYERRILSENPCVYSLESVIESFKQYLKGNMYYNIKSGKTYFKNEVIAEYSYKKDIPKIEDIKSILWEFKSHIFSSANRLYMGYKDV